MFGKKKKAKKEAPKKTKKAVAKKPAKKPAKKTAPKKEAPKKASKKPAKKKKEVVGRTYHLVKRSDGKWEVKYAGGQRAIKTFATQEEAVAYTKVMAKNQEGGMVIHSSKGANKGRIRKK